MTYLLQVETAMNRFTISFILLAIHSLAVLAAAFVEPNWDDMSPSFALLMGLYWADYPIHWAFGMPNLSGGYVFVLLLLGGAMWFVAGFVISATVWAAFEPFGRNDAQADA